MTPPQVVDGSWQCEDDSRDGPIVSYKECRICNPWPDLWIEPRRARAALQGGADGATRTIDSATQCAQFQGALSGDRHPFQMTRVPFEEDMVEGEG